MDPENHPVPPVRARGDGNAGNVREKNRIPAPPAMAEEISPATPAWGMDNSMGKSALHVKGKGMGNVPGVKGREP